MRKLYVMGVIMICSLMVKNAYPQVKLAQTGFQFLSVGADARACGMGEAFTTVEGQASALFYNPAGMARLGSSIDMATNYTKWIADITHYSLSCAFKPKAGRYGVFGISVLFVDYGEIQGTMVWPNPEGYIETEVFRPAAYAIGIGYARALTDKFVVGGQIKHTSQSLGKSVIPDEGVKKNIASTFAYDFGTIYRTGFKSLSFGMCVRNFSPEVKFEEEGFQLPLTFKIGISMDLLDIFMSDHKDHSLLVAIDAAHPRAYREYINLGMEYKFMNMLALRVGYVTSQDEYGLTAGFGVHQFGISFDYAYTPFGVFGNVHRFTLHILR